MSAGPVVISGGTGFLGRRVVARCRASGMDVTVAARHARAVAGSFPDEGGSLSFTDVDVREEGDVRRAVEGAQAVVNCVALYVETRDATFRAIHVDGARNVAAAASQSGADSLVHISGIGSDASSSSAYVRARGEGEAAVRDAFPQATILRPSVMFGPHDAFLSAIDGVATMTPVIPLFGSGETKLQPVHVDDVAQAVARAIAVDAARGDTFELGGGEVLTYRRIVELVVEWKKRKLLLVPFPFAGWDILASAGSLLPSPPITEGQVALMKRDNVVGEGAKGFGELGIVPRTFTEAAPAYLPGKSSPVRHP
jgi:NADH dehydrogenase